MLSKIANIEANIKLRNQKKGNLMKRALQMIATEIGSPELMELLKSMESTEKMTTDEIKSILGVQLSQEVYDSLNYFLLLKVEKYINIQV